MRGIGCPWLKAAPPPRELLSRTRSLIVGRLVVRRHLDFSVTCVIADRRFLVGRLHHLCARLYVLGALVSIALVYMAWQEWIILPLDKTEVLAFVTGAWSVWFAARNNVWTWPIGIANSAFFVLLFWDARLFFDMSLNVFYVLTGLWGWGVWSFGGQHFARKPITRIERGSAVLVLAVGVGLTLGMWRAGVFIDDAAPFLDALTTALSMGAQWLLMRRSLENWYLWIAADVVYIPLYVYKALPLTAVLYGLFLLMCCLGVAEWRLTISRQDRAAGEVLV
jgi:nicotinamide mononucleotide transporter